MKAHKRTNFMRGIYEKRVLWMTSLHQNSNIKHSLVLIRKKKIEQIKLQPSRKTAKIIVRISKHLSTISLSLNIPN